MDYFDLIKAIDFTLTGICEAYNIEYTDMHDEAFCVSLNKDGELSYLYYDPNSSVIKMVSRLQSLTGIIFDNTLVDHLICMANFELSVKELDFDMSLDTTFSKYTDAKTKYTFELYKGMHDIHNELQHMISVYKV